MTELWRDIPGYEGRYQASNLGRIRSLDRRVPCARGATRLMRGRVLRSRLSRNGYPVVTLPSVGPREVHQLVALAFIGPRLKGQQVRHLNGVKLDPRAVNLAYGTQADNERDKFSYGDRARKLTLPEVREIRRLLADKRLSNCAIGRLYGVTETTVRHIAKGVTFGWLD